MTTDFKEPNSQQEPELLSPNNPLDPKELLKLRCWKIINEELNFHELKSQQ